MTKQTQALIEQEKRLKYLDLVTSAVILQNTVDMSLAIQTFMSQGEVIPLRYLADLSPSEKLLGDKLLML